MEIRSVRYVTLSAICNSPDVTDAVYTMLKGDGSLVAPLLNTVRSLVSEGALIDVITKNYAPDYPPFITDILIRMASLPLGVLIDTDN